MAELGHYCLVRNVLRTAFLVYVRVLLCLQGLGLLFLAWAIIPDRGHGLPGRGSGAIIWPLVALALILTLLGLAIILTAVLLRRGRPRAAMAAIAIEALWAVAVAAIVLDAVRETVDAFEYGGHPDEALPWWLFAGGALFLVATVGLLLRPVRAYTGLVRADRLNRKTADSVG
jgi:drug/metabolite transporter (DMT)-like permease